MTDLDKMARDILDSIADAAFVTAADFPGHAYVVLESEAHYAIRAALLTAPPGYVLVPVIPTEDMEWAPCDVPVGGNCYMCSKDDCSRDDARRIWAAMLAAAPEPEA